MADAQPIGSQSQFFAAAREEPAQQATTAQPGETTGHAMQD